MFWRYRVPLTPRQQGWIAACVFTLVGIIIFFGLPRLFEPAEDGAGPLIARLLGGVFILLGVLGVAWMTGDAILARRAPDRRDAWFAKGGAWLGALGALIYAVPATMVLPVMLGFYARRPNALFPPDASPAEQLLLGAFFSITGAATVALVVFLLRQPTGPGRNG